MKKQIGGLTLVIATCLVNASAVAQFNEAWTPARYNGTASGNDRAVSVLADKRGNTYAVGFAVETGGGESDIVVRKYGPLGNLLWMGRWDNISTHLKDVATAAVLDNDGNCFVAGTTATDRVAAIKLIRRG